jgi:hypothetical protein
MVAVDLYSWQKQAINSLRMNSYNGVVVAVTGSGKTKVATEVMKELRTKTLIVVPTIHLMTQWRQVLVEEGFNPEQIGIYYGEKKKYNKITVAVINSICDQPDLDKQFGLLVCDECLSKDASILMSNGKTKQIQYVKKGDLVQSYNIEKNIIEDKGVVSVFKTPVKNNWLEIIVCDDNKKTHRIYCSPNHKIYTTNRGYIRADKLNNSDMLKIR